MQGLLKVTPPHLSQPHKLLILRLVFRLQFLFFYLFNYFVRLVEQMARFLWLPSWHTTAARTDRFHTLDFRTVPDIP